MKYLFLIILSFYSILIWGQHSDYKLGNTLYVWKFDSVKVKDKPEGNTILNVAYGEKVTVIEEINHWDPSCFHYADTLLDDSKFIIKSHYIKVKYKEFEGYVFEKYLDLKSPFFKNTSNIIDSIVTILPGQNSDETRIKRIYDNGLININIKSGNGESEKIIDPKINENIYNMIIYKELLSNNKYKILKQNNGFYSIGWIEEDFLDGMGTTKGRNYYFNNEQGMILSYFEEGGC